MTLPSTHLPNLHLQWERLASWVLHDSWELLAHSGVKVHNARD